MKRREFLQFLGATTLTTALPTTLFAKGGKPDPFVLPRLAPSLEDRLSLAQGLEHKIFLRWGDALNATQKFGFNNDFIAFHKLAPDRGILWVNHEYVNPTFIRGRERSKENVDQEMLEVGGTLVEVRLVNGEWTWVKDSRYNRRLDANTKIDIAWPEPIADYRVAIGTMGNCAGGQTPWGTILTCEENYDAFWGERDRQGNRKASFLQWERFYPRPPEHYGWVVEVNPLTGECKKLISLGRCAHECATVARAKNGKVVAYTGDDAADEHLYKFVSDSADSLDRGKLYVASLEKGEWLSLDINDQPILREKFKSQTEIQVHAREAAKLVGATPLARPEDIEIDPLTGSVLIALTNNKARQNFYGSILKISEDGGDYGSLKFKHDTYLTGGKENGVACPDNLAFDRQGNLWFTTDMAGRDVNRGPYEGLGNNALFVLIRSGAHAGEILRLANAPVDAEFTGPCFSPDQKTLFLAVQHPGENGTLEHPTSSWPDGGIPKSAVVTITGPLLERIVEGRL
jgi:secreted PhoX family phosphatase